MSREQIESWLLKVFEERFEIIPQGLDEDLREQHHFDSIDAVELLSAIEGLRGRPLRQEEMQKAVELRTLNQICSYVQQLLQD